MSSTNEVLIPINYEIYKQTNQSAGNFSSLLYILYIYILFLFQSLSSFVYTTFYYKKREREKNATPDMWEEIFDILDLKEYLR